MLFSTNTVLMFASLFCMGSLAQFVKIYSEPASKSRGKKWSDDKMRFIASTLRGGLSAILMGMAAYVAPISIEATNGAEVKAIISLLIGIVAGWAGPRLIEKYVVKLEQQSVSEVLSEFLTQSKQDVGQINQLVETTKGLEQQVAQKKVPAQKEAG